jgi:hypothetical protein
MTYLNNFKNADEVIAAYEISPDALKDAEILLAWYGDGCYSGDSVVVFRRNGKLYEVNGSHCSCHGLEGQWQPEETSPQALLKRKSYGSAEGENEAVTALHELANRLLLA